MPSSIDPDDIALKPTVDLSTMNPRDKMRALRVMSTNPLALADLLDRVGELLLDREVVALLQAKHTMLVQKLDNALIEATPDLPNPYRIDGEAVLMRHPERPQYVRVERREHEDMGADGLVTLRQGDGMSFSWRPWDYRIRPEDPKVETGK